MPDSEILLGDCLAVLKTLEADSFDSMVTDPPAGIAFMNSEWDTYKMDAFEDMLTKVFLEAYRVLKPGAHVLVWSIPRTGHRTACAIERAGFAPRDALDNVKDRSPEVQAFLESLTEEQVELLVRAGPADAFVLHMFGQGFPKSMNVGKAIDKLKGAKRTNSLGLKPGHEHLESAGLGFKSASAEGFSRPWMKDQEAVEQYHQKMAPATPEAAQWEGFGTALKPAVETWWLARKPLQEDTVAEQVLATGTGALNIDGCRVGYTKEVPGSANSHTSGIVLSGSVDGTLRNETGEESGHNPNIGRWPANVVLQHGPDCKLVGKKKIKGKKPEKSEKPTENNLYGSYGKRSLNGFYASEDGTEPVDAWECASGCPVKTLDEQSGNRPGMSGGGTHSKDYEGGLFGGIDSANTARNDSGGASRFFNQFEPDIEAPPFFYTGKITSSERKEDLEEEELVNKHPTVKSKKLMRHLVRLITPPKGRVLDPFCGSGSTIVAAIEEGMVGTGIERDPGFHEIATKRVQSALQKQETVKQAQEAWDLAFGLESE
jgi:site-specific DNA-methyltransferase (adenine-specific)